eukprot:TRINITY_DN14711_c0_g1_i1.p1 TRINITY_DN14711_c0_g1~~TRINITY_DN14711_c0_g1_i1.p1  ORF type:complete len:160 (+),score=25.51 TRINITY_DN14711_c0_g1_i1:35-481(+)
MTDASDKSMGPEDTTPKGILRKGADKKPKGNITVAVAVDETTKTEDSGDQDQRTARRSRLVRKQTGAAPTTEEEHARKQIVKNHLKGEGAALKASQSGGESATTDKSEAESSHSFQIGRSSDASASATGDSQNTASAAASRRSGCTLF